VPDDETKAFAIYLGETLQLTNILRDVDEDAAIDRLYVPLSLLREFGGNATGNAQAMAAEPAMAKACIDLAAEVDERYRTLPGMMPAHARRALRSALIMQHGYERIFRKLVARGWQQRGPRPRLSKRERISTMMAAFAQ